MIEGNLAFDYVDEIPWKEAPAFIYGNDTEDYLTAFQKVVNIVPIGDYKIKFSDNTWDFKPYFTHTDPKCLKFIFEDLPDELKIYSKFYVLHNILGKKKIPTIYVRFSNFKSVINSVYSTSYNSLQLITTDILLNEIKRRNISPSTEHNLYESLYQFYYFFINDYKLDLPVDIKKLKVEGIRKKQTCRNQTEDTKIPNIPEQYFIKILNMALKVMRDENESFNMRMTSALIVILSQTGLRLSELLSLKTDDIYEKKLKNSGIMAHYMKYVSYKPSKAHSPLLEFNIFCNNLSTEAFDLMVKLREQSSTSVGHNYLYVLATSTRRTDEYPIIQNTFKTNYHRFFVEKLESESQIEWPNITQVFPNYIAQNKKTEKYSIPDTRQFRVHLCTALYDKGVPLAYIQRYMGHLSEYMMGYYVRPKDTYQENIKYSEQIIKNIVQENLTPLGGNNIGEELKNRIISYIENNKLNIEKDIDAILNKFGDKVIIRAKTGGVCIKTSLMPCSKDARTNEMMCAYNLCPNLFHFFYMIDVTYLNFKTLQETYQAMKIKGQLRAAEKELVKLRSLLTRRIEPEIIELKKEINKKGINVILDQHPTLIDIIENIDNIENEIRIWKTFK